MKERDVPEQANEVADRAFGDDFEQDVAYLEKVRVHARGCGCEPCQQRYRQEADKIYERYFPDYYEATQPQPEQQYNGYFDADGNWIASPTFD